MSVSGTLTPCLSYPLTYIFSLDVFINVTYIMSLSPFILYGIRLSSIVT